MRAKYSFMAKQLEAAVDLRKKMEEHNRDQQRQLTAEREEKKNLQKRYFNHLRRVFNESADDTTYYLIWF